MQMVKDDLDTVIDRLQDYVAVNHTTTLANASKVLGIPAQKLEKFALLLEESGLLEVKYGLKDVLLISKNDAAEKKNEKKQASALDRSVDMEREVMMSENLLEFMESDIERRIRLAEEKLKSLEQTPLFSREEGEKVRKEFDTMLKQLELFGKEIEKLSGKEREFYSEISGFKDRIDSLESSTPPLPPKLSLLDRIMGVKLPKIQVPSKQPPAAENKPPSPIQETPSVPETITATQPGHIETTVNAEEFSVPVLSETIQPPHLTKPFATPMRKTGKERKGGVVKKALHERKKTKVITERGKKKGKR